MALNRKYSALPDLDTAPDVYETPELTDDNSTVLTTAGRSQSDDESDVDDADAGISRSHVQVGQARSRFLGADVDARGVDFSDRVDGKRKAYRTANRRHRGAQELGDLSDEEDGDSLERKIARLKREVEETKEAYARQKAEEAKAEKAAATAELAAAPDLDSLSQTLDELARLSDRDVTAARIAPPVPPSSTTDPAANADAVASEDAAAQASSSAPIARLTTAVPYPSSLAQVADFDSRLVLLERSIGIGSSVLPELDGIGIGGGPGGGIGGALPRAILPTLDALQRQIGTLADASTASLDGISRRVRALTQEADELTKARKAAKAAHEALVQAGASADVSSTAGAGAGAGAGGAGTPATADMADEQSAKINALYGTLPTIESLTPLLPPLLDRLRSLRAIHADAAAAGELLDDLEQRQADTAAEVRLWREGLEKIEVAMREGDTTMNKNMQVMDGWVKGLEERLDKVL
ncbi:hypothetical protein CMQ_7897 [Grosmannia clavigera kw1407]|uniref:Dynactin subunit n=1 Tax=Grosmannia clavigera (strain kw1407 / UAMH 11150) TaxID=655863 RepID=F0XRX8_GROCL|nr:uncharacterized protein CMQ_7897 [Grosmannia clavigera kw1407]EFW99529.1 hypothetical protein CMQ_7897 [Grosmannia clavigera kw1407]